MGAALFQALGSTEPTTVEIVGDPLTHVVAIVPI